jgi:hypothetical protein
MVQNETFVESVLTKGPGSLLFHAFKKKYKMSLEVQVLEIKDSSRLMKRQDLVSK